MVKYLFLFVDIILYVVFLMSGLFSLAHEAMGIIDPSRFQTINVLRHWFIIEVIVKVGNKSVLGTYLMPDKQGANFEGFLDGQSVVLNAPIENYLVRNCSSQPIVNGGGVIGIHVVFLENVSIDEIQRAGTVVIFSFQDVTNKKYEFQQIMTGHITPPLNPMTLQKHGENKI